MDWNRSLSLLSYEKDASIKGNSVLQNTPQINKNCIYFWQYLLLTKMWRLVEVKIATFILKSSLAISSKVENLENQLHMCSQRHV